MDLDHDVPSSDITYYLTSNIIFVYIKRTEMRYINLLLFLKLIS